MDCVCLKMFRQYLLNETFQQFSVILGMKFELPIRLPITSTYFSSLSTLPYSIFQPNGLLSASKMLPQALYMLPFALSTFYLDLCLTKLITSFRLQCFANAFSPHFSPLSTPKSHYLSYFCQCMYHYKFYLYFLCGFLH